MNWPIVMYMGLVVAAPYLMWKLVASVAGLEGGGGGGEDDRETARGENEASWDRLGKRSRYQIQGFAV